MKAFWLGGLMVAFLGLGMVHGQEPSSNSDNKDRGKGKEPLPAPTPEINNAPALPHGPGAAHANNGSGGLGSNNATAANNAANGPQPTPSGPMPDISSWVAY